MAEAMAAIGLAASIATFVDLGIKVVKRLQQFHSEIDNIPEKYQSLMEDLPLTIVTLKRIKAEADAGRLDRATTEALTPCVRGCENQVEKLEVRLQGLLPSGNDTFMERTVKALNSLIRNQDIQEIAARLHNKIVLLLTCVRATRAAEYGPRLAARGESNKARQPQAWPNVKPRQKVANDTDTKSQQVNATFAWTPLHDAAKRGDEAQVRALLTQGADVNTVHATGGTPLLTASNWNRGTIVSLLLDHGARINTADNTQTTPLCAAALRGNDSTVKLLLDRGARINPPNNLGRSALHDAARLTKSAPRKDKNTTVQVLLDRGADINVVNDHGWTPLHNACNDGRTSTAKLLLDRGANPNLKNKAGLTPIDLARKNNHVQFIKLLLQHMETLSQQNLHQPKDRWERLGTSPVRIVFREAKRND